ncbi:MAG: hypothetical protein H6810_01055 [Phycisphaeraceae bacterium]|nr:MAG: hypothetical protein H6810_01055 [Phycisphaeraceae bacterium]
MTKKQDISTTDALVFAGLWVVFFVLLAALAWWSPRAFVGAAVFTGATALVSIAFNSEIPRGRQGRAIAFPAGLMALWFAAGLSGGAAAVGLIVIGVVGAGVMLASRPLATGLRAFWMDAGAPIGWTVSAVLLAVVYFIVITPIGLVRRMGGGDTLQRRFDDGPTYWIERNQPYNKRREYRQY